MKLFDELKERFLLYDTPDIAVSEALEKESLTFYLGTDPTGDSLHVGHLVTQIVAKTLENHGHKPIILVGGATGLIGDPKQQGERKMLAEETVKDYAVSLKKQISDIFGFTNFVNNYDWVSKINVIEFLRDFGKNFNVNNMINKETVKARLDNGISYTEFSYQILQALDWYHLYKNFNCTLQIGGQDQWGNMISGMDLIRKKAGADTKVYAFTIPLILKSDGTKFGKSEGGKSVWLNKEKTSPYEFYQFWINTPDNEVIMRLKQFTFLPLEQIALIEKEFLSAPHLRLAQKTLAAEVTKFVHGEAALIEAQKITDALFSGDIKALTGDQIAMAFNDFPFINGNNQNIVDAAVEAGLASSKREAREFTSNGAILVNGDKVTDLNYTISKENAIDGKFIILRRGKKKYALIKF